MDELREHRYTVSQLTELIRKTLESEFFDITVEGEISNFRPSSTGHYYFTLKDNEAVISVVMFKNRIGRLKFKPADGQLVVVRGSLSVYAKRGSYQIICEEMEKAGEGDILAMLEERKRKFAEEGFFDTARKRPLPIFPSRVAIVTSPTGAALRDILRVLRRRNSNLNLVILPSPVQGDDAAGKLSQQIKVANMFHLGEVIILTRGGGSIEDLLPFSDERVIRAVYESKIPVISAVGHEIDTALSDLVADVRAPTPSAAAEMVSTSIEELENRVFELKNNLIRTTTDKIERIDLLLKQFTSKNLERNFRILIQPYLLRLDDSKESLISTFQQTLKDLKHKLTLLTSEIRSNSPLYILERGYAVVTDIKTRAIITSAKQTRTGEEINVRFLRDSVDAKTLRQREEKDYIEVLSLRGEDLKKNDRNIKSDGGFNKYEEF
ncbi:MAG: exodeoxyribonuclease VII large subunit [Spirochaetes bacterium]|nr:MAG: exodeoxyribonuclease VII large subunit [Spirochaetota bacterium]